MPAPIRDRKLTDEQVRQIRSNQLLSTVLAKHYGVSAKVIRDIRNGRHYKHVPQTGEQK